MAAAAYRAGERIQNQYDGANHDYRPIHRRVVHSEIILPEHAPKEYADRATLWNAVERKEKAKNARLSREVRLALPIELSREDSIQLVREYVRQQYIDSGMIADINVHDSGDGNPHAHIMLTMRSIDHNGYWMDKKHKVYILDSNGNKQYDPVKKTYKCRTEPINDWNDKERYVKSREAWANCINEALKARGFEERVDHRSYEEQGIDKFPMIHMGAKCSAMERRDIATERGEHNREIAQLNEAKERYCGAVHDARVESPIYRREQESMQELAYQLNRQDSTIDFCSTKMVEGLNKAVADGKPESVRDEIVKTWRERIAYAEREKTQTGKKIRKTRIAMFPEYSKSIADLEKARSKRPQDEKAIQTLTARVDAAEKITFKELRDAANAYTQAQKEYASASYKLQFAPDDKVQGAIAEIEASKVKMDACKAELVRVKTLFVMDERESMQQAKAQGVERKAENARREVAVDYSKAQHDVAFTAQGQKAALGKRDWTIAELKQIPRQDVEKAVHALKIQFLALMEGSNAAKTELAKVGRYKQREYTALNRAIEQQRTYDALKEDKVEKSALRDDLKAKIDGANVVQRISGKAEDWKRELAGVQKEIARLNGAMEQCETDIKTEHCIDLKRGERCDMVWGFEQKARIDEKYKPLEQQKKKNYVSKLSQMKAKRLEVIEKIALAKDQNKLDEEGHSMREAMRERLYTPEYIAHNAGMLKNASEEDKRKILERKEQKNQSLERDALGKAIKVQAGVSKAIDQFMSIGEDNFR